VHLAPAATLVAAVLLATSARSIAASRCCLAVSAGLWVNARFGRAWYSQRLWVLKRDLSPKSHVRCRFPTYSFLRTGKRR